MAMGEEESKPVPSSGDWDISKEAFVPDRIPRKVNRAWERVPVVAQAPRLHGSTVWKKVETRKNLPSKDIAAEVQREWEANGIGARKRIRGVGDRVCIQDATWATVPAGPMPYLEVNLETSSNPTSIDSENRIPVVEEDKGTFPAIHFVPRKRTHNDQIITPKKAEVPVKSGLTEEAQRLLNTETVHGSEETPARRRKSARMSMANRRVTLGGPALGLESPLKSTPSKGLPVKIFESGGGANGGSPKMVFGSHTLSRSSRRTTVGGTNELLTPAKAPLRRSLRMTIGGGRKSLSALQGPKVLGSNSEKDQKFNVTNHSGEQGTKEAAMRETDAGITDNSPKRKRISSVQPATRKSSRLSIRDRTSTLSGIEERSGREADITVLPVNDKQGEAETLVPSNHDGEAFSINNPSAATEVQQQKAVRLSEAPDIFGTSQSRIEEFDDSESSERPSNGTPRPPTRRSSREFIRDTPSSNSKVNILISIKSVHMANISSGIKTHEFRTYKLPEATEYMWLYETAPKQCLTHVAKIGPAKVPGEINGEGLGNDDFNAKRDKPHFAYEILQLYALKDELSLNTILEKQYAKGPPQKYSFASQKLLNDISLFQDASLLFDEKPQTLTESAGEVISLPQLSNTTESVAIFSPKVATPKATLSSDDNKEVSAVPDELSTISTQLDSIEEESVSAKDAEDDGDHLSPEQKASLRLRSPPPVYEDLLNVGGENSAILLSPSKDEENKLSELSPIQLGNKLLEEESTVSSPLEDSESLPSSALNDSSTGPAEVDVNPNLFISPPHEDTIMLKNFVTRVKANKAASVKDTAKPAGERVHSPMRLPLAYKDSNLSPLPKDSSPSKTASPATISVETPSVPKSNRAGKRSNPLSTPYEGEPPIRRSGRTRTPVKGEATSSLPLPISAPSSIPLRRLGGNDGISDAAFAIKQKAEKELAALTRINTKKNAGPHSVSAFLARQTIDADTSAASSGPSKKFSKRKSPTSSKNSSSENSPVAAIKGKATKRKSVMWAEELLQYQDAPSLEERSTSLLSEAKKPVKVGMRSATASKIAIGMGISGPAAPTLIPDLVLTSHGSQSRKSSFATAAAGTTSGDSNVKVVKKKSLPVPQKEKVEKSTTAAAASSSSSRATSSKSRIATPNSKSKAAAAAGKSRIAVGRGVNGTPAPKASRKVKGKA